MLPANRCFSARCRGLADDSIRDRRRFGPWSSPDDVTQGQDIVRFRRQPGHRACDRAARCAGRRQCRDRGEDRRAAPETQGHHLHRGRRDSDRRRPGAADPLRHPRGSAGDGRHRPDRRRIRRHRYLRQQCQRHQPHQFAGDRHEAVRPDDGHQHPRHLHGVQILHPASEEGGEPAHSDAVAAARHEDQMVRGLHRLYHGEVRHEHVRARPVRRTAAAPASRSMRCGRAPPSPPRRSAISWAATP